MTAAPAEAPRAFIDLTDPDVKLESYEIRRSEYNCSIIGPGNTQYSGFILASSRGGNARTVCEVDFQFSSKDGTYPPRLVFRREDGNGNTKLVRSGQRFQRIAFQAGEDGYRQFWQMIAFLTAYKEATNLERYLPEYRFAQGDNSIFDLAHASNDLKVRELIERASKSKVDFTEITAGFVHQERLIALELFADLLLAEANRSRVEFNAYKSKENISELGTEVVWRHFLRKNRWMFALALEIRPSTFEIPEVLAGSPDSDARRAPHADMLRVADYSALIENKTPKARFFSTYKGEEARADTWTFSLDFISAVSQSLGQRSSWERSHASRRLIRTTDEGDSKIVDQEIHRTLDPHVYLVYGCKDLELPRESDNPEVGVKRDTLEGFSRNSRNVSIVSYDELYSHAYYIVHDQPCDETPWRRR